MHRRIVVAITLILSGASPAVAQELDAFLGHYHSDWHRWGHREAPLWGVEHLKQFAEEIWGMGNVEAFELDPIRIVVDGDAALAHYRVKEVYRVAGGMVYEFRFRWSDFLVEREGQWRLIGGSRDDTCAVDQKAVNRCPVEDSEQTQEPE